MHFYPIAISFMLYRDKASSAIYLKANWEIVNKDMIPLH